MARLFLKRRANNATIMATTTSSTTTAAAAVTVRLLRQSMILGLIGVSVLMLIFIQFGGGQQPADCTSSSQSSSSSSSLLLDYHNATTSSSGQQQQQQLQQQEQFTACLKNVLENLPIGKGRRAQKRNPNGLNIVAAHHYDANTKNGKWNAGDRFLPMPQLLKVEKNDECSVWEVGAHKKASDSATLLQTYPNCTYHAFEPIPAYFKVLQHNWKEESRMHLHNFGIGARDEVLQVNPESLQEQATYIGDYATAADASKAATTTSTSFVQVQIKSFANAMAETGAGRQQQYPTLLHMNCEGCEWDLLPQGMDAGFIQQIPIIQVGFHNYGHEHGLGGRVWQLCEIRQRLAQTHTMVQGAVPFAWERWVLQTTTEHKQS